MASADPAAAWPQPGAVALGHRERAGEFRAANAFHRRARGDILAGPPGSVKRFQSFRGDAQHRTQNLEIPGLVLRTIPE